MFGLPLTEKLFKNGMILQKWRLLGNMEPLQHEKMTYLAFSTINHEI